MEDLSWDRYTVQPVKDRSAKVQRRKDRMPVNGIAMKRLLIERAAKAQAPRCMAAKFLRHIGSTPATRHAVYAHCDRLAHEDEGGHHFIDPYGRIV